MAERKATWTVVLSGEVTKHQEGSQFAEEFPLLLLPVIEGLLERDDVRATLTIDDDRAAILVIAAR